ncbi:MAG: 2-hydroxyacyl-CoA dehydratase [Chloroflexi bacterium]|nr:2-hydroxyacyl-CoA dehydratase [Chloroflexota bacterium]
MKSHAGLEALIQEVARRIKRVEESPGSTLVDRALLEVTKERLEDQLDAWRQGRPSIDGEGCRSALFRSMGFLPTMYTTTYKFSPSDFRDDIATVEKLGLPADKLCDKVVTQLAMRSADSAPKPDAILADSHGCDNDHKYYARVQGDLFNIPVFFVDVPLHEDDKVTLTSINYVAEQYGEFIEWAEKTVPGVKYDEDKHIEALEMDAIARSYCRDIYQLLKHVPCPCDPRDALGQWFSQFLPSRFPNMRKAAECIRHFRDQLGERVASGKGPYPEERLRLLWAGMSHDLQVLDPRNLLLERRVALPMVVIGYTKVLNGLRGSLFGEVSEYGVKLSPLQHEASEACASCWGGPGKRWVNDALDVARDLGTHGIIHFQLVGCTPGRGMGSVLAERADKELGIPTLNLEGRYLDRDYMSQERFEEILSTFIDQCFDRAGKPRQ